MRPPLFGLNSSATLSSENSFESIAHSFRRSALFRCAEMRVHSLLVSPLHSKLLLFHSFPLAGLCLPLNALSHIIPKCMRPPLFGLNSSATLSYESIAHSFRRSALFRCAEMRAVHSLLVSPLHSKLCSFTHFRSRRKPVEFQVTNVRCSLLCRGQEKDAFITSDKARRMSSLIFLMKIFASKNLKLRALRSILADRHG